MGATRRKKKAQAKKTATRTAAGALATAAVIARSRANLLRECERRFGKIFEAPFTDVLREEWRAEFKRLCAEDTDARRALDGGRFTREKAERVLRKHKLPLPADGGDPLLDFWGHAPTLDVLFHALKISRDPPAVRQLELPRYNNVRAFVIHKFQVGYVRAPAISLRWGPPPHDPRRLSDTELAIISLLLDPEQRRTDFKNGENPPTIIELERAAMVRARERAGDPEPSLRKLPIKGKNKLIVPRRSDADPFEK